MGVWAYTIISVLIVSFISFTGVFFLSLKAEKLQRILIYLISFSAGALFGDAFLHLIPEAAEAGFELSLSIYILSGLVLFFIVDKIIKWRHCHHPITVNHAHPFAIINLFGDGVHNFIDGLIIGASYVADIQIGIATTLAVVFHEIPQEIGDFGVLLHGGFSKGRAMFVNFLSALAAVLGAIVALLLASADGLITILLPLAAGGFIYIAGSDLIPELHKEVGIKKSLLQLVAFVLGILIMAALLTLE